MEGGEGERENEMGERNKMNREKRVERREGGGERKRA